MFVFHKTDYIIHVCDMEEEGVSIVMPLAVFEISYVAT